MSNRLVEAMTELRSRGARGLSPYITAGDGGLDRTKRLLHALQKAGATCCELGVPFSDPIADGPVLQAAAERALAAGTTLNGILDMVRRFRDEGGTLPIALMSYCNPLAHRGWEVACQQVAQAGVDALILPDLPVEEGEPVQAAAAKNGLCTVFFAAPTSGPDRIRRAAEASQGFLYVVGRTGVTGAGTQFDSSALEFIAEVRDLAGKTPTAVGFGIASAADVTAATLHADLAIVGTALVRRIHDAGPNDDAAVAAATEFVRELCTGCQAAQ